MCSSSHSMVLRVKRYWDMTSHIFSWSVYYEQKSLWFMSRCGCNDRVNVSKLLLIDWYRVGLMNNLIVWGQASLYKLSGRMCELDSCFHLNCYYWLIVISCKYNFNCLNEVTDLIMDNLIVWGQTSLCKLSNRMCQLYIAVSVTPKLLLLIDWL